MDPLGIGVPNLGKSEFDLNKIIESGFQRQRANRMLKDQQDREDYQNFINKLPSFDAFNNKLSTDLNNKVQKMKDYAEQKFKAGVFSPFVKTERGPEGKNVEKELKNMENELATITPFYKKASDVYAQAEKVVNDPTKKDLINRDLTLANMKKIAEAKSPQELAAAISENPIVFKETPVDMFKYFNDSFDELISRADQELLGIKRDPRTGLIVTETGIADNKAQNAGMRIFRNAMRDTNKASWINENYKADKEAGLTKNAEGLDIDKQEWFIREYMPELGNKATVRNPVTEGGTGKKKPELTSVSENGLVWKTGPKAINVPDTIEIYKPDGSTEEKAISNAKLSEFGYGKLPDGSMGKYVKFIVTSKDGANTLTEEYVAPYEQYKKLISDNYVAKGVEKLDEMSNKPADIKYNVSIEKKDTGTVIGNWWRRNVSGNENPSDVTINLTGVNGEAASVKEVEEFKKLMNETSFNSDKEAADMYSRVKTFMRDNEIKSFDEAIQILKDNGKL